MAMLENRWQVTIISGKIYVIDYAGTEQEEVLVNFDPTDTVESMAARETLRNMSFTPEQLELLNFWFGYFYFSIVHSPKF